MSSKSFELIHSDLWGPAPVDSYDGYKYFVLFIDDKSRATWLYLLKSKTEVISVFQEFHNMVINQFDAKIKSFRTDNGTEYTSGPFSEYLRNHGILHETSCVGTPQQNGVAERKNRHILETARALMFQMNIPKRYWSHGVLTATYLINRLPSRVLEFKSPLEVLKNQKLNISHLRVFGCVCYVHQQAINRDKLDPRAVRCVFFGYSSTKKGYMCYNMTTRKLIISRDVKFVESESFFQPQDDNKIQSQGECLSNLVPLPTIISDDACLNNEAQQSLYLSNRSQQIEESTSSAPAAAAPLSTTDNTVVPPSQQSQRRSTRQVRPPEKMKDFFTYHVISYPMQAYLTYDRMKSSHSIFLAAISNNQEPKTFKEANTNSIWRQAMHEELQALDENKTWNIVKLPHGKKTVGCRWIYKIKHRSDGTIERHKARLVARGFTQTYGEDYKETFAPVAKMNTFRVLVSLAVNENWRLYQMDVKNAFLHGELEEEVYMRLPPGHPKESDPRLACKLNKALYGLKQSPRAWYAKLSSVLTMNGLQRSDADSSLFVKKGISCITVVLVYVDDIVITGNDHEEISKLKAFLHRKFAIKDLGILKYFLGIEAAYSTKGIFLNQRKYVLDLLQDSGKLGAKPAETPTETGGKPDDEGEPFPNVVQYQRLVGRLIYLTITRPDISYAVSLVSRFMHAPKVQHMDAVNRILRYLKGSAGRGIWMRKNGHTSISAYTDADWAGCPIDRRSTTGYCIFVGGNLVTWKSKKQNVVAKSSAEAEYRAMSTTTSEIIWLRALLKDLSFPTTESSRLFCDNQAAIHIASNPVFHERTKHIEVNCHFVREKMVAGIICTPFVSSNLQLADIFTKGLTTSRFQEILFKLGSIDIFTPT